MIRDLTTSKLQDIDHFKCYLLACRRTAHKLPLMCAVKRLVRHHLVPFRDLIVNSDKKIVQIYTQWMFNALTITGVSNQTCGAKAWYAQTCTHALPVRTASVDLTMPGPKYWKPTKMRVSTQFVGELNAPQASKT